MKKLAITGGKGGTGKSTVAVLTANKLIYESKKVVLVDCDVECPNDYLLLGQELKKAEKKIYGEFPELIKEKCTKCGICVKTCRENAIFQPRDKDGNPDYPIFIRDLCSGCGACWTVCPFGAIKPKKEEIGKIYLNKIKSQKSKVKSSNFYLITGVAKEGLEETGSVVTETKKFALDLAKKVKADYLLIDTAAGTHCPVISALLGTDKAFCVTEPTPMGAYDLKLILDLCQKIEIPAKIIINQADLGNKKRVEKVAKDFKVEIDKEIPYSKELVEAYSEGNLLNFKLKNNAKAKLFKI